MPYFRTNTITGDSVIIAEARSLRPQDFKSEAKKRTDNSTCPFCPGNEHMNPAELYVLRNSKAWEVRVVQNKYPFVSAEEHFDLTELEAYGSHEVLIDTPSHEEQTHNLTADTMKKVLIAIKTRIEALKKQPSTKYIQVFKNSGQSAGASKEHSHWQIVSVPLVLPKQQNILDIARKYHLENNKCIMCDEIKKELLKAERIVEENDCFVAFESYASRFTYETWIAPREHISFFENMNDSQINNLASILSIVLHKLVAVLKNASYNICIMNSPYCDCIEEFSHFHIQILPRLGGLAGFEFSTGCNVNAVPPEKAAKYLRECSVF